MQGTGCYLIAKYCANAEVEASSLTVRLSDSWLCLHWGSPEGEKQQERMKGMKGQAVAYHTRKVPHSIATSSDPVRSCQNAPWRGRSRCRIPQVSAQGPPGLWRG